MTERITASLVQLLSLFLLLLISPMLWIQLNFPMLILLIYSTLGVILESPALEQDSETVLSCDKSHVLEVNGDTMEISIDAWFLSAKLRKEVINKGEEKDDKVMNE